MDLHILDNSALITPTTTGTYRIYTHTVEPVGLVAARKYAIQLQDGLEKFLFEYRHVVPTNVDASNSNGLLVFNSDDNWLLDTTPRSKAVLADDEKDAALALGRTLASWDGKWTIRPLAKGGSGESSYMDARVTFIGH
jgi:hypothetical protein